MIILILSALLGGCGIMTDAATRVAFDIEAGVKRLGAAEGTTYTIQHQTPSFAGQCGGPYTIQFDKVGALIIWCKDDAGRTVSSHSTTYHSRFVDTSQTVILDKPAGSMLTIRLERRHGRAVIAKVE